VVTAIAVPQTRNLLYKRYYRLFRRFCRLIRAILLRQAASRCDKFAPLYTIWGVFEEDLPHINSFMLVLKAYRVLNSYNYCSASLKAVQSCISGYGSKPARVLNPEAGGREVLKWWRAWLDKSVTRFCRPDYDNPFEAPLVLVYG
jgi:hypothetical protein